MDNQLAKEEAPSKNLDYSRPLRNGRSSSPTSRGAWPDATRHSNGRASSPTSRGDRPDARRHSSALPALTEERPFQVLRTSSSSTATKLRPSSPTRARILLKRESSKSQSCIYEHLPEDAAIADHPTFQHPCGSWENAEKTLTSAFFLVWAVGVILLGGWHVSNQLSASIGGCILVAVAVLAPTCAFCHINRKRRGTLALDLHPDTSIHAPAAVASLPRGKAPLREAHGVSGEFGRHFVTSP